MTRVRWLVFSGTWVRAPCAQVAVLFVSQREEAVDLLRAFAERQASITRLVLPVVLVVLVKLVGLDTAQNADVSVDDLVHCKEQETLFCMVGQNKRHKEHVICVLTVKSLISQPSRLKLV